MDCKPGALRSGAGLETSAAAGFMDDLCGVNGGVDGCTGDDLFVEELLDFSNGYSEREEQPPPPVEENEQGKEAAPPVSEEKQTAATENAALSVKDDFVSLAESEISAPEEGLESLEWLSHFVEDSFSDYSLTGKFPPSGKCSDSAATAQKQSGFTASVQTKARTKRARTGMRVWPVLSPSFSESSTSSSSSTASATSFPQPTLVCESFLVKPPPLAKKQKKKPADGGGVAAALPRRCSHCGVTKTPQWRAGPLGSKTLCNACGVRFKSGRLLPEYRPACSPSFTPEIHSNSHRKVLEMRRKKEAGTGMPPSVQSF